MQAFADTPLPAGANYLFSVPGVVNAGGVGTFFTCTSVSASTQTVTVEVFDQTGAAAGEGSVALAANTSTTFGTQSSSVFIVDTLTGSGVIRAGAARILSTDKKLVCSANVGDGTGGVIVELPLIAKLKQKAAN